MHTKVKEGERVGEGGVVVVVAFLTLRSCQRGCLVRTNFFCCFLEFTIIHNRIKQIAGCKKSLCACVCVGGGELLLCLRSFSMF